MNRGFPRDADMETSGPAAAESPQPGNNWRPRHPTLHVLSHPRTAVTSRRKEIEMKFVNLTPHPITIVEGEQSTVYPVDGPAPRLAVEREALGQIGGIGIVRSTMGEPSGLPEPQDGVIVIVSALVAEHPSVSSRSDLAYPGEAIRDADGKIVGAKGLCAGPGLAESLRSAAV